VLVNAWAPKDEELLTAEASINNREASWFIVFRASFTESDVLMPFSRRTSSEINADDGGR